MNRSELVKDMMRYAHAGFMSRKQVTEYLGYKDPHSVDKYLNGLTRIGTQYYIGDIVDSLFERGCSNGR